MLDTSKVFELMEEKDIKSRLELAILSKIPYSTLIYMLQGHDMQVSTLVELSRFFGVPVDHLINKNYGIVAYSEDKSVYVDTASIIEATVSTMM